LSSKRTWLYSRKEQPPAPEVVYLGLDVQADISSYTLLSQDRAQKPSHGRVNLDGFPQLLDDTHARFLACEFTGRLAVPYARAAKAHGVQTFYLDTVSRAAYTRIFGQTSKTDKQDAKTIAAVFRRWAEHEQEYAMNPHLFLDAEMVEDAWLLRAMLYELKQLRRFQVSAQLKAQIAERTLLPDVASRWSAIAAALPLKAADQEVAAYAAQHFDQEMKLLLTIPGVGPVLGAWIIAIVAPIHRFETYPKTKRYIGMNPRQQDSGAKQGKQKVSRTGNSTLRGLLYLSAIGQVGKDTRFGDLYQRKATAGVPGKKAAVAVAEDIFCVAYYILKSGRPYHDPARPAAPAPELKPEHLVTQAEAARRLDVSRQAVGLMVKEGRLRAQEWNGRQHVVLKYLDIMAEQRKQEKEEAK